MQEEGSLPSERSGEGGAKRRSAQAEARKIRVPLARARGGASQKAWFIAGRGAHEITLRCCCCNVGRSCGQEGPQWGVAADVRSRQEAGRRLPPFESP